MARTFFHKTIDFRRGGVGLEINELKITARMFSIEIVALPISN